MDEIKNWGLMLVFVSAGCMIYYFLLPSGSVSKTVKSVLSVIILGVICMPVFNVLFSLSDFSFDFSEAPEMENFDEMIKESAEKAVENIIHETVTKYTSQEYKTEIIIDITEDDSINIKKVNIIFNKRPAHEKDIREELKEKLNIMPDISTEKVYE